MSIAVLGLIALGAVTHAAWNITIKRTGAGGPAFVWMTGIIAAVVVLPFALLTTRSWPEPRVFLIAALVSAILHIAYFLLLQYGYRVGDVSVVYPLARGTGPLLSVVGAVVLLGERPGVLVLAGAGVVIVGVLVIGFAGGLHGMRRARPGVLFGLLTGVAIAGYTLWDANAVTALAIAPALQSLGGTLGEAALLTPLVLVGRGARERLGTVIREHWRSALLVGVLSPVSYISVLTAMQLAPVAVVAPGREVSVVLVGLAGWLLFKEPHPVQRLIGAAVVLAGVAMLALG